ncbi:MAG: AMP-binding protein, partial [Thermoleophilaceae bacterium]
MAQPGCGIFGALAHEVGSLKVLVDAGIIRPIRPDKLVRVAATIKRWGKGHAAGYITSAIVAPSSRAIVDDLGTLTFEEVNSRTNRLAHSLSDAGVNEGDGVAIMCRNHRGFVESTIAVAKLGAHSLYLNTAFAGPQLTEVVKREKPVAIIYDEEFTDLLKDAGRRRKRFVAWHDTEGKTEDPKISDLIEAGPD